MNTIWTETAQKLYDIKLMRKHYQDLEEKYLEELKKISGDKEVITDDFEFKSIKRPGTIDYKRIPELFGIDLGKYRKEDTISWTLKKKEKLPEIMPHQI